MKEDEQFMRQIESGEWVRGQQELRYTQRETPWCIEDSSQSRLPIIGGTNASRLPLTISGSSQASNNLVYGLPLSCPFISALFVFVV